MSYGHLSLAERHYIEIERKAGTSMNDIAKALGRSQSTLSREVGRNTGQRGYRHQQANRLAEQRHKNKPKVVKLTAEIKQLINGYLEQDWSPEQIAGRLEKEGIIKLHHETLYQHILADEKAGGTLYKHLRHQNKTYRKRYGSAHNRTGIPNRVDIEQRPEQANKRTRVGDWEADTIIGKNHKGAIMTLDDRKSKLRLAAPLQSKKAQDAKQATIALLQPYHSWERGQNENANGLLRQYFPKAMER
jgi:IS30 family transposase